MRVLAKILIYTALIGGAVAFLLPLLWMLSTALKPAEQTTAQPPVWLPRRHYVENETIPREVKLGAVITSPAVWATAAGNPTPVVLPQSSVEGDIWTAGPDRKVPISILATIPATPDEPWREVVDVATGQRDVVPIATITAEVSPRWSNFGEAIRTMQHFWRYFGNTVLLCV